MNNSENHQFQISGASESGKSTFIKQMRILFGEGYEDKDKLDSRKLILENIFEYIQCLIHGMQMLCLEYSDNLDMENIEIIRSLDLNKILPGEVEERYWIAADNIWKDSGIQICYQKRNEYPLGDNAA
jgi:hypothetical protein